MRSISQLADLKISQWSGIGFKLQASGFKLLLDTNLLAAWSLRLVAIDLKQSFYYSAEIK